MPMKIATIVFQSRSRLLHISGHCNAFPAYVIASSHDAGVIAGMLYRATAPGIRFTATKGTAVPQASARASRRCAASSNFENRTKGKRRTHGRKYNRLRGMLDR